ncbi:MAG: response regulator [Planctomycetes bacterium]|nr:response regulator [Planctomycetota bacterium]
MTRSGTDDEGWLPALLDDLLEGFQVLGFDWRYVFVNHAAARHGRSRVPALIGRTLQDCYPEIESTPLFAHLRRALEDRVPHAMENEFRFADGSTAIFELRMQPVPQGLCVLSIDITARKLAEARLREIEGRLEHAARMDAIGQLAAGVAHDFKNLLSVILGVGERALARESGPSKVDLREILDAARRAADVTRELLACGRTQVLRPAVVDLHEVVVALEPLLRAALDAGIALLGPAKAPLGRVHADRTKLEQLLVNLVLNARDAMPDGGTLRIELSDVELDEHYVELHPGARTGPHVCLAVCDTGIGMDEATRARIFEPFFTTKLDGPGVGLGLAAVHGFVQQSGGSVWVYSELGRGTTFKVYLPCCDDAATPRRTSPMTRNGTTPSTPKAQRARSRVLVVEDDSQLRELAETVLAGEGYEVVTAADGRDALARMADESPFDLLLTDYAMPGMRGTELIQRALDLRPDLLVLCTSGLPQHAFTGEDSLPEHVGFLEKPYLLSDLVEAVRTQLDRSTRSPTT